MADTNTNANSISFTSLLFLLFLGLKLTGYIDWSWWWVFAPIWIPLAVALVGMLVIVIAAFFAARVIHKKISNKSTPRRWFDAG